jgi:4-oxalocrotonate tautomerase family enzyme
MRLIDCGCGPGSVTVGLAEVVAPGEVVGIDLAPRQIERAREVAAQRGRANVRFEVGTVYDLPFRDASFDAAYAQTLLMHLREPVAALREIRRVLRPGGVLGLCDDDHGACLWEPSTPGIQRLYALWLRAIQHGGGDPYYARHQRRLLLEAGFVNPVGHAAAFGGGCWADPVCGAGAGRSDRRAGLGEQGRVAHDARRGARLGRTSGRCLRRHGVRDGGLGGRDGVGLRTVRRSPESSDGHRSVRRHRRRDQEQTHNEEVTPMPLVKVNVIEGALTDRQKGELITNVTEAVLSVYGEGLRPHCWVVVEDVRSGQWGIGGQPITADVVRQLMGDRAAR